MAKDLEDTVLLTRIEGADLAGLEAKYHLTCLTKIRNKHHSFLRKNESRTFCVKFSALCEMYEDRLRDLGISREVKRTK